MSAVNTRDALREAIAKQNAGDLAAAERIYKTVLQSEPANADALNLYGVLWLQRGAPDRAERLIAKAVKLKPTGVSYLHNLGKALSAQDKADAAVEAHAKAAELAPNDPFRHEALAAAQRANKQTQGAIESLRRALALDSNRPAAESLLGDLLQEIGELDAAIACYDRALAADPKHAPAYNNLANALLKQGKIGEAVAANEQAILLSPANATYHVNLGVARLAARDAEAALAAFEKCLELDPTDRRGIAYRDIALGELGRLDLAAARAELERWTYPVRLRPPPEFRDIGTLNRALAHDLMQHRSLRWQPVGTATTGGADVLFLMQHPTKAILAFERQLRRAIDGYIATLKAQPGHPFLYTVPKTYALDIWGTVLKGQGYQSAHIHPTGWLSGVYYVQLPDSLGSGGHNQDFSGWIEFGRPSDNFNVRFEPITQVVQPEEGLAILFPSYVYHRTVPFEGTKDRISIAFDVRPMG